MEMGFPEDMISSNLIDHWDRLHNKKTNMRYYMNEEKPKARRKQLKRMSKDKDTKAKVSSDSSLVSYKNH